MRVKLKQNVASSSSVSHETSFCGVDNADFTLLAVSLLKGDHLLAGQSWNSKEMSLD